MKSVAFFPWVGQSSVLSFVRTSLMRTDSRQKRLAILEAAHRSGITHFDTAAYFGYGEVERLRDRFLAGKLDRDTITPKFGNEPSGSGGG